MLVGPFVSKKGNALIMCSLLGEKHLTDSLDVLDILLKIVAHVLTVILIMGF